MNIIVAVDQNWAIGRDNKLLVSIPADMKFFRTQTTGNVVVMGRKTLESFPKVKGATVVHSLEELLEELKQYPSEDVYVVGGDSIYRQLLPYCDVAHVTKIDYAYEADTYFPNLDEMKEWQITASSEEQTYFDLEYTFLKYEKKA